MSPSSHALGRKKSFWRKRPKPAHHPDETPLPLCIVSESIRSNENEQPEEADETPKSQAGGKLQRLFGWIKSWHTSDYRGKQATDTPRAGELLVTTSEDNVSSQDLIEAHSMLS